MKCKTCGKNSESEYCFVHKPRKPLPSGRGLISKKSSLLLKKLDKSVDKTLEMKQMFMSIWKKRKHYSEVSGKYLGQEAMSTYFHHILPKSKYPEACFDEENIILLTLSEHDQVEMDMYRYEEVNTRRKYLLEKYERS